MAVEDKNMAMNSVGSSSNLPDTKNSVVKRATLEYLSTIDLNQPPSPDVLEKELVNAVKVEFDLVNSIRAKGDKLTAPKILEPSQIADVIMRLYYVANVAADMSSESTYDILAIYQQDGQNEGVYVCDDKALNRLIRQYNYSISGKDIEEVKRVLVDEAPRMIACHEPNLVAVNNGIFDFDTKTLLPFTPEKVFLSKSKVNYNVNAKNIVIHNPDDNTDWDVESWMHTLSDDDEVVNTLWEVLGAIIRPNVSWGKAAWFYSESGNNGKGTLCELMRQLCGPGTFASVSLAEMGKDFGLEPLIHSSAIIVDENNVGTFIDKAANLKSLITHDVVTINRKYQTPVSHKFYGFMVQCLNEMPKVKDKSDSFYRRQLFIPFTKCFTGAERKYIKDDYLKRREVLEYVLYKVLNMDYYELSTPEACKTALEEYKEFNDPVREFAAEIVPQLAWNLVPNRFLYDLYKSWYSRNVGNSGCQGRNTFLGSFMQLLPLYPEWQKCKDESTTGRMDASEPLIAEYELHSWKNKKYNGKDVDLICKLNPLPKKFDGILRINS